MSVECLSIVIKILSNVPHQGSLLRSCYAFWAWVDSRSLVPPCLCMCCCFSLQCLPFWVYLAKSVRCSVMPLFDPMAPLSMRILQERMLEWVAIPFSRGIFPTQGKKSGLLHCRQILSHQGSRYQMGTKAIVLYSF